MDVLRIENLTKSFGLTTILNGISFAVPPGSVFGFIGENGAGKTTTMKIILGLLKPDSGSVTVCGERVRFGMTKTNRNVGYLPDVPEFYPYMRAREYLKFCGEVAGLTDTQIKDRSGSYCELVGLATGKKRIGAFSRGMKQRLGMAQALMTEPQLLICDEPTSALDPVGRKDILDILRLIRGTTTVIFSTHILSDVERICDSAAVLHQGRIVLEGTLQELKTRHGSQGLFIEFDHPDDTEVFCELIPPQWLGERGATEVRLRTADKRDEHEVLRILAANALVPLRLEVIAPSIESLFLEAVS
ncbi:MAG: ABC transporter ATP-binding protein [Propionibacteriaceae bacterium]|jgi:ABC-2 type transport system ATP-binding protein|nr:ABC transporter ATP-binding protein [Propionibacteriaceae bacterium]